MGYYINIPRHGDRCHRIICEPLSWLRSTSIKMYNVFFFILKITSRLTPSSLTRCACILSRFHNIESSSSIMCSTLVTFTFIATEMGPGENENFLTLISNNGCSHINAVTLDWLNKINENRIPELHNQQASK